jgi:deoxyhypusine synthase
MSYEKDTYSLAKGLHHINNAKQYFEDVKMGCTGDLKNTFNGYINKCDYILNNIFDKLGEKTRKVYKKELSDSLGLDAINDQLMMLDNAQRNQVEELLEAIIKGKKVTIKIDD